MSPLPPWEVLYDGTAGRALPLPRLPRQAYGILRIPRLRGRPYVVANFATTLDGVVALQVPGRSGATEITGAEPHDRALMGLLRAAADAVVVGAGTLRSVPRHRWTAPRVFPAWAGDYARLRRRMGKPPFPLNVVVSAHGKLDLTLPIFSSNEAPVRIVTTEAGARRLHRTALPVGVDVRAAGVSSPLRAAAILGSLRGLRPRDLVLVEGGPHLIGEFLGARALDELFLTVAPQIAGRDGTVDRPGLVAGRLFAPEDPLWGALASVRRSKNYLFLRFRWRTGRGPGGRRP